MPPTRSLAAAQTIPIRGDVDANVERHLRLVHIAAAERAQVLVFPELSLTGYELDLAGDLAFSQRDPRLTPLVEAAAASSMTLIVGAPVRMGSRLHIGAFVLSPDGTLEVYTKQHLGAFSASASPDGIVPPAEATVFAPGTHDPLVHFGGNVGAVAVCADVGHPSHPQAAAERGARTYFASMFVVPTDLERDTANLRTYAVRHSMAVVFANYGGPSGGLASGGGSTVWSERGEPLAQLGAAGTGVAFAGEDGGNRRAKTVLFSDG
jgi:predicted amidohydrolase